MKLKGNEKILFLGASGLGDLIADLGIINAIKKAVGKNFVYKKEKDRTGEVQRSVLNSAKAKKILGWRAKTKLDQGIKNTIDWVMSKK